MKKQFAPIIFVGVLALNACSSDGSESADTTGASTTEQTTPTTDSADTTTTSEAPTTDAPSTSTTSPTTTSPPEPTSTDADPSTTSSSTTTSTEPDVTTTVEPVDAVEAWSANCAGEPFAPPFLRNGESVGEPASADLGDPDIGDDRPAAIWAQGTDNEVIQLLDSDQEDGFAIAASFDEVLVSGRFEAAVVPVGPPTGPISIDIRDADQACTRQYSVPAAFTEDEADSYAAEWIEALNQ